MMVQTEIGLLPDDWEVKTIDEVFSLPTSNIRVQNIKKSDYVSTENLLPNKAGLNKYTSTIDYSFVREYRIGDTLMSNIRPYLKKVWYADRNGGCSSDVIVFRPSKEIDSRYAYFLLSEDRIFKMSMETSIGTKMPRGDKSAMIAFPVALPKNKTEQQNIASALSSIDKLIDDLGRTISKKQLIREGAMEELLSGKKRLPGFTDEWVEKEISLICEKMRRGSMLKSSDFKPGCIPVIAAGLEPAGYHNKANRDGNTITVSSSGANAGYIQFNAIPFFAGDCFTIESSDTYDVKFIYYALKSRQKEIYKLQTGGAQPHVHPKDLGPYIIPYTDCIKEQQAIADILTSMDDEISVLQTEKAKYELIRAGMMEELLTGAKRLK